MTVLSETVVREISRGGAGAPGRLRVDATAPGGMPVTLHAGLVLVVTGVRPETSLAVSAGAALGARGAISVDKAMRTGLPGVYAAGDCVISSSATSTPRSLSASTSPPPRSSAA